MAKLSAVHDRAVTAWIARRLRPWCSGVASVVPDGYEAYVRIFHPPVEAEYGGPQSWAGVATHNGRTMHALAQFHAISTPAGQPVARAAEAFRSSTPPEAGPLPEAWFRRLCELLSAHTATPDDAMYCIWEGYGGLASMFPGQPRAELPQRAYFVFEGGLDSGQPWLDWADELQDRQRRTELPNLFWPGDRGWCVASEIDFCWTLVGCSRSAADTLLADPEMESWPVDPGDSMLFDGDRSNI